MRGSFVVITGIDGSGKSTAVQRVASLLKGKGMSISAVRRNDLVPRAHLLYSLMSGISGVIWSNVSQTVVEATGNECWLHLRMSYYLLASKVLDDRLAAGESMLVDDWYYKFYARLLVDRQPMPGGDMMDRLLRPDRVILLDVDAASAAVRKQAFRPGESGLFAGQCDCSQASFVSYQRLVSTRLRELAARLDWDVIDGNRGMSHVASTIATRLDRFRLRGVAG